MKNLDLVNRAKSDVKYYAGKKKMLSGDKQLEFGRWKYP